MTAEQLGELAEDDYVDRIIDAAHAHGWHVAHFRPARTARGGWRTPMKGDKGFPDLVLTRGGRVLLAEVKTNRGTVRPEQRAWLAQLGDHAHLWRPRDWPIVRQILASDPAYDHLDHCTRNRPETRR